MADAQGLQAELIIRRGVGDGRGEGVAECAGISVGGGEVIGAGGDYMGIDAGAAVV